MDAHPITGANTSPTMLHHYVWLWLAKRPHPITNFWLKIKKLKCTNPKRSLNCILTKKNRPLFLGVVWIASFFKFFEKNKPLFKGTTCLGSILELEMGYFWGAMHLGVGHGMLRGLGPRCNAPRPGHDALSYWYLGHNIPSVGHGVPGMEYILISKISLKPSCNFLLLFLGVARLLPGIILIAIG